jgi:hypothetical protein
LKKKNRYQILASPASHFIIINIISIISCYFLALKEEIIDSKLISSLLVYSTICIPAALSLIFLKTKKKPNLKIKINTSYLTLFVYTNLILTIFFLINLNYALFLKNGIYLTMLDVNKMGVNIFPMNFYLKAMPFNGALCMFLIPSITNQKNKHILLLTLIFIGIFSMIYQLGNNSRSAILILFGYFIGILFFKENNSIKYIKLTLIFCFSIFLYFTVIFGRGQTYQGVSRIDNNINLTINRLKNNTKDINYSLFWFQNTFEGAYIFYQGYNLKTTFPENYKLLSFSPFTSSIDGFNSYLKYTNFISPTVPFGTFLEVYHFGLIYILFYYFLIFFLLIPLNRITYSSPILGYLISSPAYMFFIANQQYPLRNYFRFLIISSLISLFILKISTNEKR